MLFFVTFSTETKTSPKGNKNDDEEDGENDDEEEDKEEVEDREPPLIRTGFLAVLKDVTHPFHWYDILHKLEYTNSFLSFGAIGTRKHSTRS